MLHYTCGRDRLAEIEMVLVSNGYTVAIPPQKSLSGATAMVMADGANWILLGCPAQSAQLVVEIWGDTETTAAQLLESMRVELGEMSYT